MITDGLNPLTVLLFVWAVLAGAALLVLYVVARVTKREPLARVTLLTWIGVWCLVSGVWCLVSGVWCQGRRALSARTRPARSRPTSPLRFSPCSNAA